MDMNALYSVAQVRAFDRIAIERHDIPGYALMRVAAAAAFDQLLKRWPATRRIVVVCGGGNNGGDGFALASLAASAGLQVALVALQPPRIGSEAAQAAADWSAAGGCSLDAETQMPEGDVYVDAIFGIGFKGAPEGAARSWTERMNSSGRPIVALDVPSGVDADCGNVPGTAIRADLTVTFVANKRGLFTGAARNCCGDIVLADLGLPEAVFATTLPEASLLSEDALRLLPPRDIDVHKGNFGHVLALGGDAGMGGAIRLTSEAALRVGAGLVSVATRSENVAALNSARPELMVHGVYGPQEVESLLQRASVIAIGPGLGQRAWGHALWHAALDAGKPGVFDADALNLLARDRRQLPANTVLTPHPGEAARLLGIDTAAVNADRFAAALSIARNYGAVAILKGAGSLIAAPTGEIAVCPWGNPGMASGGMGDVLTGVIAGLLAQGLSAWDAACAGVALHARAADVATHSGQAGMIASDLFAPLRALRNGLPGR